ncbi:Bug family tripartite tricarboxylate transporter substrate binding protein [Thermodesulfobacteriota bacterium]
MKKIAMFALVVCMSHAFLAATIAQADTAGAQNYPDRMIKIIVGFSPGAGADFTGRLVAKKLQEALGQTVIVENHPGAGGVLAAELVANSAPDGYTLWLSTPAPTVVNQNLMKLPYDPLKAFAPISRVGVGPCIFAVRPGLPAKSIKEVIELARTSPKQLSYGSSGIGGTPHMATELFMMMAKVKMLHVPYKGSGPAVVDVMADRVDLIITTAPALLGKIRAGSVRALGVSTLERFAKLPDVPTIDEAGVPGYEAGIWWGLSGVAGTPKAIIDKLNRTMVSALKTDEMRSALDKRGAVASPSPSPQAFAEFLKKEADKWAQVTKTAGIKKK